MICLPCRRFFRPKKTGVTIEELRPLSSRAVPGELDGWAPYKLWQADLYACPSCEREVIGGFGAEPVAEHYEAEYSRLRERLAPIVVQVSDCGPTHAGWRPAKLKEED